MKIMKKINTENQENKKQNDFTYKDIFIEDVVYGKGNGEFSAGLVDITIDYEDGSSPITPRVWQLVLKDGKTFKGSVSMTILLQDGKYDRKDVFIEANGSAQQWAKANFLNGMNQKLAFEKLAIEANKRGLRFTYKPYAYNRKNGGIGTKYVVIVDFAD